tara:strand:+ start:46441 stop:47418 length:978 start_codon:yes stop_codon:yes gene_type:complete
MQLPTLSVVLTTMLACGGSGPAVQQASSKPEPVAPPIAEVAAQGAAQGAAVSQVAPSLKSERRILEYLPSAYGVVIHLSLRKLESSELFTRHETSLLGSFGKERQAMIDTCHIDPMLDFETITFAIDLQSGSPSLLIALTTPLGATRVEECLVAMGGTITAKHYDSGDEKMGYHWPTQDVLLLSPERSSDEIRQSLLAGTALDNPGLMEYLSRTDRNATLWGGGSIPSAVAAGLASFGGTPQGFVVRGSAWAGIDLSVEMSFATSKAADTMMSMLKMGTSSIGQSSPAREVIEATTIEQLDRTIRVDAQLSPSLADELFKMLKLN